MTKLEKLLLERGIKQFWLAKKINKSPVELNRWVKGKTVPVYANMNIISKALGISVEEIFYKEGIEEKSGSKINMHDASTSKDKPSRNI